MIEEFQIEAPGKIILFGEHSVVYGKKAIACAINKRVKVKISPPDTKDEIVLRFSNLWNTPLIIPFSDLQFSEESTNLNEFCEQVAKAYSPVFRDGKIDLCVTAVTAFLYGYLNVFENPISFNVSIESDLPIGAGLGSSAAFNSAIACAFLYIAGEISQDLNKWGSREKINSLAFKMETIVHSSPSGIDNSVSVLGGALSFQSGNITHFDVPHLHLLIVDTRFPRSTKILVQGVREKHDMFPKIFDILFNTMHAIAEEGEDLLKNYKKNDNLEIFYKKLGILFDTNQGLLNSIGVGHESISNICSLCKTLGFSCKLTGAGGGGCVLVLVPPNKTNELSLLKEEFFTQNFSSFEVDLGTSGVFFTAQNTS